MSALERAISHLGTVSAPAQSSVPVEEAQHLDAFCQAILALLGEGDTAEPAAVKNGLEAVERVGEALSTAAAPSSTDSHWQASTTSLSLTGGRVLKFEDGAGMQELSFHLDANGVLYLGSWRSLKPEPDMPGILFDVRPGTSGWEVRVSDGAQERRMPLAQDVPGYAWTRSPAFAEQFTGEPGQPTSVGDWIASLSSEMAEGEEVATSETAEEAQPIFCPQCGKENPPENNFCGACGSRL